MKLTLAGSGNCMERGFGNIVLKACSSLVLRQETLGKVWPVLQRLIRGSVYAACGDCCGDQEVVLP
jgi:hypothetical protein